MTSESNYTDISSKKIYLPNERGYFDQEPRIIKTFSKEDYTTLPDPVTDPTVCNNIAWLEFDYTSPAEEDTDLHSKNEGNQKSNNNNVNK